MQINLIVLINLAPDCLAPMQISLLQNSLAPAAILNIIIFDLLQIKSPFYNKPDERYF